MPEEEKKEATEVKAGYKTSEFWLSAIAEICGLLLASGAIADGSMTARIVGGVVAVLAGLGYAASRSKVKAS